MRLINTRKLTLHDFAPNVIPEYAILSHTWSHDETTLQEFSDKAARTKAGFRKIESFCEHAAAAGFDYGWIDTCCIDKSSSAELSEAINSMFKWYQQAGVCFAYLSDVSVVAVKAHSSRSFRSSRWFTRGWTLQELIAPTEMIFFSNEWARIGTRHELSESISQATGIEEAVLRRERDLRTISVATKFSWAAGRQVTRDPEDLAYSLLGICDVAMPLLYGEGEKAFRRLQEEIMKTSTDPSLFAWTHDPDGPDRTGLLAPHVRNFKDSGLFEDKSELPGLEGPPHQSTSKGITVEIFLSPPSPSLSSSSSVELSEEDDGSAASRNTNFRTVVLKCAEGSDPAKFAVIEVEKVAGQSEYVRVKKTSLSRSRLAGEKKTIVIRHESPAKTQHLFQRFMRINLRLNVEASHVEAYSLPSSLGSHRASAFESSSLKPREFQYPHNSSRVQLGSHVRSDPWTTDYLVPLVPGSQAVLLGVKPRQTDKYLLISVGLDENGEIGINTATVARVFDFDAFSGKNHYSNSLVVAESGSLESRAWQALGKVRQQFSNFRDVVMLARPNLQKLPMGDRCDVDLAVLFRTLTSPKDLALELQPLYGKEMPDFAEISRIH